MEQYVLSSKSEAIVKHYSLNCYLIKHTYITLKKNINNNKICDTVFAYCQKCKGLLIQITIYEGMENEARTYHLLKNVPATTALANWDETLKQ